VFGNKKKKEEQAINLVQSGSVGVGTLTHVQDTGITINELADHDTFAYVDSIADDSGRQLITSKFGDAFGPDASGVGIVGAAPVAPPAEDPLDKLKKLGELRDAGVLTPEEFEAQKAAVLSAD
jgi:hypothetical protein